MKIHFYATLRPIVGGKTIEIPDLENITAQQLLDRLIEMFPALQREMIAPEGTLYQHMHYFINGRDVRYLEGGMETVIGPNDTVNIFPPVGGG